MWKQKEIKFKPASFVQNSGCRRHIWDYLCLAPCIYRGKRKVKPDLSNGKDCPHFMIKVVQDRPFVLQVESGLCKSLVVAIVAERLIILIVCGI